MIKVRVIGAGLAGCEAACTLSKKGYRVELVEMKPLKYTPAHKSENFAELVCSNSLKAARVESAAGLLKAEMRLFGSVCLDAADKCSVAAGGALAVDRDIFSQLITERVRSDPNIEVVAREETALDPDMPTIIAAGPLVSDALFAEMARLSGGFLSFYDAAAPIVSAASLDMSKVHPASRYDRGGDDYLNCYFNKENYEAFWEELVNAELAPLHDFEQDQKVYEGCMPIEKLAKRGKETMRFGPLKPVGLRDPNTGHRPWAAVQLRRENAEGTMFNIVGFQTNLKFGEQRRVFSMIPGLENAEFLRYGVMHRNSFLDSPKVLSPHLSFKNAPNIFAAGQITGFEGYMESACCGILAANFMDMHLRGKEAKLPPVDTMCGALLHYVTAENRDFQPMGANMGLLPELPEVIKDKRLKYGALAERALASLASYMEEIK